VRQHIVADRLRAVLDPRDEVVERLLLRLAVERASWRPPWAVA
jgi:hypothetical protein